MTIETIQGPDGDKSTERGRSLSWTAMLLLVLVAILVAAAFAYLLVSPFFHQTAPQTNSMLLPRGQVFVRALDQQDGNAIDDGIVVSAAGASKRYS